MVSVLKQFGFESCLGTLCCVLRQDTLTVPLSTQVYKCILVVIVQWTSISSRGSEGGGEGRRNTPSRFMLQKLEISTGLMVLMGHFAHMQT